MFKLESGKYYRNRKGDVVGPVKVSGCYYIDGAHYWSDGRKYLTKHSPDDLIEEVPKPNEQPIPSDYHLQRAIDVMGMDISLSDLKYRAEFFPNTINVARYIAQYEPEPVDPVLLEARRRVEEYLGYLVGSLEDGSCDDTNVMKLVIDALRFNIADFEGLK